VQVAAVGSKFTWANPLATLAVIDPERCVLRSRISVTRPSGESWIEMSSRSPARMNRSVARMGVKVPPVWSSGAGGAWGLPFKVMNAKLAGSMPTLARQSALLAVPVFWSELKVKMAMAAHHCVASQLIPPSSKGAQPGG
jgi:hypothetical protein